MKIWLVPLAIIGRPQCSFAAKVIEVMFFKRDVIENLGDSGFNFVKALKYIAKGKLNINNTCEQITKTGIGSIFIVTVTGLFVGLAMSTQLATELTKRFGAQNIVGGIVAMGVIRELAPVITSIVIAARVGTAISAEIGSMKASEQIDALSVLGINPIQYLLVPRLIATAIVTPLLTVLSGFLSIIAGMWLTKILVNLSYTEFLASVRLFISSNDVYIMVLKSTIYGIIVAIISTSTGLQVQGGAEAVGAATTKTVVWSMILIFIFNYIITAIFFGT